MASTSTVMSAGLPFRSAKRGLLLCRIGRFLLGLWP
jgi:hypothetical protein